MSGLKVENLPDIVANQEAEYVLADLTDVRVASADTLAIGEREVRVSEDEGLDALSKFLDIPRGFLKRLDSGLIQANVQFFIDQGGESPALFEVKQDSLSGAFPGDEGFLPREQVSEALLRTFPADADVVALNLDNGFFSVDVTMGDRNTEPRQGDVIEGGLRWVTHIAPKSKHQHRPYVSEFYNRLVCSNGMTRTEESGAIRLRGKTVDEIIEEMEQISRTILDENTEERLHQFNHLTEVTVDNVEQFVHRIARQNGLSARLESRIIDDLPALEERTAYDVMNLITSYQHEGVSRSSFSSLQEVGGYMATSMTERRCASCAAPLGE